MAYGISLAIISILIAASLQQQVEDVAWGMQPTVDPTDATCGVSATAASFGYTTCTVDTNTCTGNVYPLTYAADNIVCDPLTVGGQTTSCNISYPILIGVIDTSQQLFPSNPCYLNISSRLLARNGHAGSTITMWLRPTYQHGTVLMAYGFAMDFVSNQLSIYEKGNPDNAVTSLKWTIPTNAWTHLAIQVYSSISDSATADKCFVFINGVFQPPAFYLQLATRKKRQSNNENSVQNPNTATAGFVSNLFGAQSNTDSSCEYLRVDQCRQLGFSASVAVNSSSSQESTMNWLLNDLHIDSAISKCSAGNQATQRSLWLFVCAEYFQPCMFRRPSPWQPCQAFCQTQMNCLGSQFPLRVDCSRLSDTNCVNDSFVPDYKQFFGTVKELQIAQGIWTNREIEANVTGSLPVLEGGNNKCLCSEDYPAEEPDSPSYCISNDDLANYDAANPLVGSPLTLAGQSRFGFGGLTVPEYMTDFNFDTAWQSAPGLTYATITVPFAGEKQVQSVSVYFNSLFPYQGSIAVSVAKQPSLATLTLLQYLSDNCTAVSSQTNVTCIEQNSNSVWQISGNTVRRDSNDASYVTAGYALQLVLLPSLTVGNTFKISAIRVNGSDVTSKCVCYSEGTVSGSCCTCSPTLDPAQTGVACEPYITSVYPPYGPVAGGTNITIQGALFGSTNGSVTVTFGDNIPFTVVSSNDTYIQVTSPPYTASTNDTTKSSSVLTVTLSSGFVLRSATFEYRPNPDVYSMLPRRTFLKGGINQTVTGSNLDSVAVPVMWCRAFRNEQFFQTWSADCNVINSTTMICRTPDMGKFNPTDLTTGPWKFTASFRFDGFTEYENLSLPMSIFSNPNVFPFPGPNNIYWYSPSDGVLSVSGSNLDSGCELKDYTVQIGADTCLLTQLLSNQLACNPPSQQPDFGNLLHPFNIPQVVVTVGYLTFGVGYLGYNSVNLALILGLSLGLGIPFVCGVILFVICYRRYKHKKVIALRAHQKALAHDSLYVAGQGTNGDIYSVLSKGVMDILVKHSITGKCVVIGAEIGRGHFGKVYAGKLYKDEEHKEFISKVAVKCLIADSGVAEVKGFFEEALVMRDFDHVNVLSLIGVVVDCNRPLILLPLMTNGDLKSYVAKETRKLTVRQLTTFCLHIARGMKYLSDLQFVHRDLAARNCMVDENLIVKIADFGMARDVYGNVYYKVSDRHRPLPVKWMAIESLEEYKFTTKSDVWSFGVVMWEVVSRGIMPYAGIDNVDMKRFLLMGRRLDKPRFAPESLYSLMVRCWLYDPDQRPTFEECAKCLDNIIETDDKKIMASPVDYLEIINSPSDELEMAALSLGNQLQSRNSQTTGNSRHSGNSLGLPNDYAGETKLTNRNSKVLTSNNSVPKLQDQEHNDEGSDSKSKTIFEENNLNNGVIEKERTSSWRDHVYGNWNAGNAACDVSPAATSQLTKTDSSSV